MSKSIHEPIRRYHIVSISLILFVIFSPTTSHAGVFSTFSDKVKAIFMPDDGKATSTKVETSQTIALFKPVVVNENDVTSGEARDASSSESLQAVSGPMRVSTEDSDFSTNDKISVYEVKKGDTLADVAKLFGVSRNTIMWANDLKSQKINPGDTLVILPMTGTIHNVKKGDTVSLIAKKYKADADDIAKFNGIATDAVLAFGDVVLVPEGEVEALVVPKKTTTKLSKSIKEKLLDTYSVSTVPGFLMRPLTGGTKTQGLHGHNAVDIAATKGTPVYAAAGGTVLVARTKGYNGGYGNMVVIQHENSIQTVYGHLHAVSVVAGQTVNQGDQIGLVGNTGKSTGPHLHFEVRGAKNPF